MKKTIAMFVGLILSASTLKAIEVPAVVEKAFQQKFPTAKKVKWEKEKGNEYEASFMLDTKEMSAVYSPDGQLKETETEIQVAELPKAVIESLQKKHPGTKIKEAASIVRSDNTTIYEVEVKINGKKTDLLFDSNGNVVN